MSIFRGNHERWRALLPHLAIHTATSLFSGTTASGFASTKVYRAVRKRQKAARLSRRRNRD